MTEMTAAGFPLSVQQRRLWALREHGPLVVRALKVDGELDRDALGSALGDVISRHEILRTRFEATPGLKLPLQVIDDRAPEGSGLAAGEPPSVEPEPGSRFASGIDPATGPPLRAWLGSGADGQVLVVAASALCADRRSLDVVLSELSAAYAGRVDAAEPVHYADFCGWQESLGEEEGTQGALSFWRERAAVATAQLGLPMAAVAAEEPFTAGRVLRRLEVSTAERIREAGGERFVATSWHTLLWRLRQPSRMVVDHVVAGRPLEDVADAVGPYAHAVPVLTQLEPGLPFSATLEHLGEELQRAVAYAQFVGARGEAEAPGAACGWQFVVQTAPPDVRFGDVTARTFGDLTWGEPYELRLVATERDGRLDLELWYDASRVAEADAERLLESLEVLLEAALDDPSRAVDELPLLPPDAVRDALTRREGDVQPAAETWPQGIAAQAERTPDAVAVEYERSSLTYSELVAEARGIAAALAQCGVRPGDRVAVCLERSTGFVAAIVGTMTAGAAYVPLDPDHPAGYLARILRDAGARVVITQGSLLERFADQPVAALCLDGADAPTAADGDGFLPSAIGPDDLAYAIYTSGSTGEPKGVMVAHRSVMSLAASLGASVYAGLEGPLRVSVNAPFTFDASVKQLVRLTAGDTVHVLAADLRLDAHELSDHLEHRRVDVLDCTPSQLRPLLNAIEIHEGRRHPGVVLVGGEAVGQELWTALRARQRMRAYNVYGPTEATVDATYADVDEHEAPTIGRPLPGVQALVVDAALRPVPPGVLGELCLGGWGLARGYIGAPDLTAASFVDHPGRAGERLYRTGDLARARPDGTIEYAGRRDRQVKVRGFRVGLSEIEAAITAHPAVEAAAVVDVSTPTGSRRLAAFLVAAAEVDGDLVEALRQHVGRELPEHMHPASYEVVDELPVTAHGKVDGAALRERAAQRVDSGVEHVPPRTPTEEALAEIWRSVLETERVGVHDDFFDAGGDSISQIIVVARAKDRGLPLTPRDVFERPTIAALAEVCDAAGAA